MNVEIDKTAGVLIQFKEVFPLFKCFAYVEEEVPEIRKRRLN